MADDQEVISIENMKKLAEIITEEIDEQDNFTLFIWEETGVHYISSLDDQDMTPHLLAWLDMQQDGKEETRH